MENKKIALFSGANKGIGFEIARGLLRAGCRVYLGARDVERGQQAAASLAPDGDVQFIELELLELTDQSILDAAAARIQREEGRLDILVNNAGTSAAGDGPPSRAAVSEVEQVIKINLLGTLAATQTFLPLVRRPVPECPTSR